MKTEKLCGTCGNPYQTRRSASKYCSMACAGKAHALGMAKPIDRFLAEKVEMIPMAGCWIWLGSLDRNGYGSAGVNKTIKRAHRHVYESLVGPISAGLTLDHKCRVRCCVNPHHLEPVPQGVNTLRGNGFSAINANKTHCSRGHELSGSNLALGKNRRVCRACNALRSRKYKERKLEKSHDSTQ